MAPQRLRQRGLATLAIIGLLTLIALGGALLSLRLVLAEEARLRLEARRLETDIRFEAALLHLLQASHDLDGTAWQRDACHGTRLWPDNAPFLVRIHLDRCQTGPDRLLVRLESLDAAGMPERVYVQLFWRKGHWRIRPGSWHDFAP